MILNDFNAPRIKFSREKLDAVLENLCQRVIEGQQKNPDFYGMVAAAVIDPKGQLVTGINYLYGNGRVHAENDAIDRYEEQYGELPRGSIIVTTLSPCSEDTHDNRHGKSCTALLNSNHIRLAYCGYKDPTQADRNKFVMLVTENETLHEMCKDFADTFLGQDLTESLMETAEDEQFLQQVGNRVEDWAEQFKAQQATKTYSAVEPGTLRQVTGLTPVNDRQNHLLDLGLIFFKIPLKGSLGAYRPAKGKWGGDIAADIRYLIPDNILKKSKAGQAFERMLLQHENDLASTVAHELRHALDDYLSKGRYDSSAHKFDYHDQTVEINAFFTQALKSLQAMIDAGTVDSSNLQWAIRRVFYNNELISNLIAKKDPRVKRLYARAYNYFKSQDLNEDKNFNQCYTTACKLYDKADAENLNPLLLQVAGYKGDGSTANTRWLEIPPRLWQHYVTVVGDMVLDPTAKQFGTDKATKYPRSQLDHDWEKQYQIKPKELGENFAEDKKQKPVVINTNPDWFGATIDKPIISKLPVTTVPFNQLEMWEKAKNLNDPKIANWVNQTLLPELKKTGKLKPLTIMMGKGKYLVIDGNHRYLAYQAAGFKNQPVPVQLVPKDMIEYSTEKPADINENFADGKGPGRPGDSQRHGIPKGATIAQLEKASHAKGRKGQLARWQLNMRREKKK
jgi:pyrimidine deaminase RibD-like protein